MRLASELPQISTRTRSGKPQGTPIGVRSKLHVQWWMMWLRLVEQEKDSEEPFSVRDCKLVDSSIVDVRSRRHEVFMLPSSGSVLRLRVHDKERS